MPEDVEVRSGLFCFSIILLEPRARLHASCSAGLCLDPLELAPKKSIATHLQRPSLAAIAMGGDIGALAALVTGTFEAPMLTMEQLVIVAARVMVTRVDPPLPIAEWSGDLPAVRSPSIPPL